jgi:uncharacterized membrane protein
VTTLPTLVGRFLIFGIAGWTVEALYEFYHKKPPRYSALLGGEKRKIPFLPIYGFGGVVVGFMAPAMSSAGLGIISKAVIYGASLTAVELIGCQSDRLRGICQWDYGNTVCNSDGKPTRASLTGCVDIKHTAAWAALALAAEKAMSL